MIDQLNSRTVQSHAEITMDLECLDPNDKSRKLSIMDAIKAHERGKQGITKI